MNIVVFETETWAQKTWQRIKGDHEVRLVEELLTSSNVDGYADAEVISTDLSRLDAGILGQFEDLQIIAVRSTGVDKIDLSYCAAHGIMVCNVPDYAEIAVAEHVFALLLSISRHLSEAVERTRKGIFSIDGLMGFDLYGKTLGIIGTGVIGRHVGKIARGFGMQVIAFDVKQDEQWAAANSIRYKSFQETLSMAEVITLHIPLKPDTHQLLGDDQFAIMKEGAVIINTARGELIDNQAFLRALASGKISAAGLDVLPEEQAFLKGLEDPASLCEEENKKKILHANHALLQMPNVIVTPHCAFFTQEATRRIVNETIMNIEAFVHNEPRNAVKPG